MPLGMTWITQTCTCGGTTGHSQPGKIGSRIRFKTGAQSWLWPQSTMADFQMHLLFVPFALGVGLGAGLRAGIGIGIGAATWLGLFVGPRSVQGRHFVACADGLADGLAAGLADGLAHFAVGGPRSSTLRCFGSAGLGVTGAFGSSAPKQADASNSSSAAQADVPSSSSRVSSSPPSPRVTSAAAGANSPHSANGQLSFVGDEGAERVE